MAAAAGPGRKTDATGPLSVYGRTKLEGEQLVAAALRAKHLIFRTSWVYAARGGNFAKTMLRLAKERERLTVIDDQFGAPTGAELLADVTAHAIRDTLRDPAKAGLYHLVAGGETTWHGYARFVLEQARGGRRRAEGRRPTAVDAVPTSAFPTPADAAAQFAPGYRQAAVRLRPQPAALAGRRRAHAARDALTHDPRTNP